MGRNPLVTPLEATHFRWLWAAYRRRCFAAYPGFPEGLNRDEFLVRIQAEAQAFIAAGGEMYVMEAPTPTLGKIPVGLLMVECPEPPGAKRQIWPRIVWFPEASPRNRLECALSALLNLKKDGLVLIAAAERDWTFLSHLCDFGGLRPVGKLRDYYPKGDAMMFQSVGS